ncbi:hypothetical protein [Brevibacillus massiliensis]|jgi:hypothetical protein|uniref:hypothetical protein n=1 Tax=Brevibacillus massiliensis TaxID=1118054 RepID=UPI0002E9635B|nr:hypothetical protein [Brevibacillus massiliensis]
MWKSICLALMLFSAQPIQAEDVELYDTDKERVIQTFANSEKFQQEAADILKRVTGRVQELAPSLTKVEILKIPLAPPRELTVQPGNVQAKVVEMFVVMPKQGARAPWLILHTKEHSTILAEFSGSVQSLRDMIKAAPRADHLQKQQ